MMYNFINTQLVIKEPSKINESHGLSASAAAAAAVVATTNVDATIGNNALDLYEIDLEQDDANNGNGNGNGGGDNNNNNDDDEDDDTAINNCRYNPNRRSTHESNNSADDVDTSDEAIRARSLIHTGSIGLIDHERRMNMIDDDDGNEQHHQQQQHEQHQQLQQHHRSSYYEACFRATTEIGQLTAPPRRPAVNYDNYDNYDAYDTYDHYDDNCPYDYDEYMRNPQLAGVATTPTTATSPPTKISLPKEHFTLDDLDSYERTHKRSASKALCESLFGCIRPFVGFFSSKTSLVADRFKSDSSDEKATSGAGGSGNGGEFEIPFDELKNLQWLASGAQGCVFKGTFKSQEVAIKKVRSREETNIKHLKKLSHPNLVQFKGVSFDGEKVFCIVMEFCPFGQLYSYLNMTQQERAPLRPYQMLDWSKQVANGMNYLHQNKIIHRDLKSPKCVHSHYFQNRFFASIILFNDIL